MSARLKKTTKKQAKIDKDAFFVYHGQSIKIRSKFHSQLAIRRLKMGADSYGQLDETEICSSRGGWGVGGGRGAGVVFEVHCACSKISYPYEMGWGGGLLLEGVVCK